MPLEAVSGETRVRIATIAEALVEQFGAEAIRVAEQQARVASGEVLDRWNAILGYLHALAEEG